MQQLPKCLGRPGVQRERVKQALCSWLLPQAAARGKSWVPVTPDIWAQHTPASWKACQPPPLSRTVCPCPSCSARMLSGALSDESPPTCPQVTLTATSRGPLEFQASGSFRITWEAGSKCPFGGCTQRALSCRSGRGPGIFTFDEVPRQCRGSSDHTLKNTDTAGILSFCTIYDIYRQGRLSILYPYMYTGISIFINFLGLP